jgi:L-seryl-tRNA(Ser) seleniumtransferase
MNIYEQLGLKKIINAWGTVTRIGGSKLDSEVIEAMREASQSFVDMEEFLQKSGEHIASLLNVEAALVTCGAAAGLAISAAACMAGTERDKILQLPDSEGMKNQFLILKCHRSRYDQGLRQAGASLVEVGLSDLTLPQQLGNAVNEKTAGFLYLAEAEHLRGSLTLSRVCAILEKHDIPVIVDAAAELPPFSNIRRYLDEGAALVAFSGGKEIRGPQSSGLLLGRKKIIEACIANCSPNHSIGRSMKVDKEVIAGLIRAVELFVARDFESDMHRWENMVSTMINSLNKILDLQVWRGFPEEPGIQPRVIPRVYLRPKTNCCRISAASLKQLLLEGDPSIAAGISGDSLVLNPQMLEQEEVEIVLNQIKKIITEEA